MGSEQRRFARVSPSGLVARQGKLILDPRLPPVDCDVIDVSAGGAQIFARGTADIPQRITFMHSGVKKSARVVWKKGRRMGLQF